MWLLSQKWHGYGRNGIGFSSGGSQTLYRSQPGMSTLWDQFHTVSSQGSCSGWMSASCLGGRNTHLPATAAPSRFENTSLVANRSSFLLFTNTEIHPESGLTNPHKTSLLPSKMPSKTILRRSD